MTIWYTSSNLFTQFFVVGYLVVAPRLWQSQIHNSNIQSWQHQISNIWRERRRDGVERREDNLGEKKAAVMDEHSAEGRKIHAGGWLGERCWWEGVWEGERICGHGWERRGEGAGWMDGLQWGERGNVGDHEREVRLRLKGGVAIIRMKGEWN